MGKEKEFSSSLTPVIVLWAAAGLILFFTFSGNRISISYLSAVALRRLIVLGGAAIILGLICGAVREWWRSLWPAVILHAASAIIAWIVFSYWL